MKKFSFSFLLSCLLAFGAMQASAQDMAMGNVSLGKYYTAGVEVTVNSSMFNLDAGRVESFTYNWSLNDGPVMSQQVNIGSGGLAQNWGFAALEHDQTFVTEQVGENTLRVWITDVEGERVTGNNEITKTFIVGENYQPKTAFLEKITGNWCGWCPGGVMLMRELEERGEDVVVAAIHGGDAMSFQDGDRWIGHYADGAGYPSGAIDRAYAPGEEHIMIGRGGWEAAVVATAATPLSVALEHGWNEETRAVSITINAEAFDDLEGDFRFNAYIMENDIPAVGQGYAQRNYYNGNQQFANDPINAPLVTAGDPMNNFEHDHVVRAMLGGHRGVSGEIPNSISEGETFSYTFEYTLPANFEADKVEVVGFVSKEGETLSGHEVYDVKKAKLTDGGPVSVSEKTNGLSNDVTVYPNPFNGALNVSYELSKTSDVQLEVVNVTGQIVERIELPATPAGAHTFSFDGSELANGVYFLNVVTENNRVTQKVIKTN